MSIIYDVEKKLFENRTVVISTEIEPRMSNEIMQYLQALDDDAHKPIQLLINSPGGHVDAGWQIIDTMLSITSPVITINTGTSASMAAVILSFGAHRMSLPHARVMLHEVSAGTSGKVREMEAHLQETIRVNRTAMEALAKNCGKTYEQLMDDVIRDKWMDAKGALEYGVIDEITGVSERKIWTPKKAA